MRLFGTLDLFFLVASVFVCSAQAVWAGSVQGVVRQVDPVAVVSWAEMLAAEAGMEPRPDLAILEHTCLPDPEGGEIGAGTGAGLSRPELTPPEKHHSGFPAERTRTGYLSLVADFEALPDNNTRIPPDTHGAAGPDHLMTMLNTEVLIQDRIGTEISTVSLATFWASAVSNSPFDPRICYDSRSERWLAACDDGIQLSTSQVLFAISATDDPTGSWTFYSFEPDYYHVNWADFPHLGSNDTWIAITNNMYAVADNAFAGSGMIVIDKSRALAGGPLIFSTFYAGFDEAGGYAGSSLAPCLSFESAPALYIVDHGMGRTLSGTRIMRMSQITGTASVPQWSVLPGGPQPGTGFFLVEYNFTISLDAEQLGTTELVDTGNYRIRSAPVHRIENIWVTHHGGLPETNPDRTAVFWYKLSPWGDMTDAIVDSGVLDGGPGVFHYYPSIAVNKHEDVCVGFSRSDATRYIEAVFTGRRRADALGTMRGIEVFKPGEDSYVKVFSGTVIRWGDYSATVVDPQNDLCFYTIQEYAEEDVGPAPSDDRWGTWWAKICPWDFTLVAVPALVIPRPGRGISWADFDGDNDLDLYLVETGQPNLLLRNDDGSVFVEATPVLLGDPADGRGAAWGDYDNDGDLDLYLANSNAPNRLFRNEGAGQFTDATTPPLGDVGQGTGVAWGDYDNDGLLDLYLVNYQGENILFRNEGGDQFTDVTPAPLADDGPGSGVAWGDFDNDGDLDLYLVNDGQENVLFRNDSPDALPVFVDVTFPPLGDPGNGQGVAWGDFDNDGDLDLYLTNDGQPNKLFRNDSSPGTSLFVDVTSGPLGNAGRGRGASWGDYDNDGDLDLYLANHQSANALLRNEGGAQFTAITYSPLGNPGSGQGVAWGDFDEDGDLDLFLANDGEPSQLIGNDYPRVNHWFQVDLQGSESNRSGIGARVKVTAGGIHQIREVSAGSGFLSQNSLAAEFGLGPVAEVEVLEIFWPSGIHQVMRRVPADQRLAVEERVTTGAESPLAQPVALGLQSSYPNPFNPMTTIAFGVDRERRIQIAVFDLAGRWVATVVDGWFDQGPHEITWDGMDLQGREVASGLYVVCLLTRDGADSRKIMLVR